MERGDQRDLQPPGQRERVDAFDAEMRVDEREPAVLQQALIPLRVPRNHLPARADQRPSCAEILQRE